jgi:hypothetical protein
VRNPFRTEAEAYRSVMVLIGYFAAIVAAKWVGDAISDGLGRWLALAVFALLTGVIALYLLSSGRGEPPAPIVPGRRGDGRTRRILVLANETVGGDALRRALGEKTAGVEDEVLVVAPALNSPLRYWASDEDPARVEAERRLERSLARLREEGVNARGEVGASEPLQALEDALRTFGADEIVISTHPEGRSNWLEKGIVRAARERFAVPITHVVVDLAAEAEPR